jgi:hypothetical protein
LVVRPANLCSQWLHFFEVWPQGGEPAHVERVAAGEASCSSGLDSQVLTDASDDIVAPAVGLLLIQDVSTDGPVQHDQLAVDCARRSSPRLTTAAGEPLDQPR